MPIEIRKGKKSEREQFFEVLETAFGGDREPEDNRRFDDILETKRTIVAMDGSRLVGATATFSFELTIPGSVTEAGGVTMVGVSPTHRRRGILRSMMEEQFRDSKNRGEPVTILWASEGAIYTNFGYGMATRHAAIDLEREHTNLRTPPAPDVQATLLSQEEALKAFPDVYERMRSDVPGLFARSQEWWKGHRLFDRKDMKDAGNLFLVLLEISGTPEAYGIYRVKMDFGEDGIASGSLEVFEEGATGFQARIELWRYLFGVDLIARFRAYFLPVDHPLLWVLREPRRLRMRVQDGLWLRLIDLPEALGRRHFANDGRVVIEVTDEMLPENAGRWAITVNDGRAEVEQTKDDADLSASIEDLGATYLGGVSFTELARAGRVTERTPGSLRRADSMWHWTPAPWCPEIF